MRRLAACAAAAWALAAAGLCASLLFAHVAVLAAEDAGPAAAAAAAAFALRGPGGSDANRRRRDGLDHGGLHGHVHDGLDDHVHVHDDDDHDLDDDLDDDDYPETHLVYSVGCGGHSAHRFQLIQALALDHSWARHRQPGRLTRIVSGCAEDAAKRAAMSQTSLERPADLARFDVWFTETNDTVNGVKYVMFNRPTALVKYFDTQDTPDGVVYGVLDPDFVFLHRIPAQVMRKVRPGRPVAAYYSLGSHWVPWGRSICEAKNADPRICARFSSDLRSQSKKVYEGGSPYLMLKSDWKRLLPVWIDAMPPTHKFYSGIESDMYAYMIAFVLLGMTHTLERNLMRTCMIGAGTEVDDDTVFLHYCQRYHVQETRGGAFNVNNASEFLTSAQRNDSISRHTYSFSKYWMQARGAQAWVLECESPLLIEPPELPPQHFASLRSPQLQRKDYKVLQLLVPAINDALAAYKSKVCPAQNKVPNLERAVILHESHKHTKYLLNSVIRTRGASMERHGD